eukprot:1698020-Prymnesium_polylepis.3
MPRAVEPRAAVPRHAEPRAADSSSTWATRGGRFKHTMCAQSGGQRGLGDCGTGSRSILMRPGVISGAPLVDMAIRRARRRLWWLLRRRSRPLLER